MYDLDHFQYTDRKTNNKVRNCQHVKATKYYVKVRPTYLDREINTQLRPTKFGEHKNKKNTV